MSFDAYIYHSDVKKQVDAGKELDEFQLPPITPEDMHRFLERLAGYGYERDEDATAAKEYIKKVGDCPIQLAVHPEEISFSVPYWKGSEEAIMTACQDACELSDSDTMVFYDPQSGEWEE